MPSDPTTGRPPKNKATPAGACFDGLRQLGQLVFQPRYALAVLVLGNRVVVRLAVGQHLARLYQVGLQKLLFKLSQHRHLLGASADRASHGQPRRPIQGQLQHAFPQRIATAVRVQAVPVTRLRHQQLGRGCQVDEKGVAVKTLLAALRDKQVRPPGSIGLICCSFIVPAGARTSPGRCPSAHGLRAIQRLRQSCRRAIRSPHEAQAPQLGTVAQEAVEDHAARRADGEALHQLAGGHRVGRAVRAGHSLALEGREHMRMVEGGIIRRLPRRFASQQLGLESPEAR